jgi:hypothetical protein
MRNSRHAIHTDATDPDVALHRSIEQAFQVTQSQTRIEVDEELEAIKRDDPISPRCLARRGRRLNYICGNFRVCRKLEPVGSNLKPDCG